MPSKILVADGDSRTTTWLRAELSREGYIVSAAESGVEVLEKVIANRPDLLILDPALSDIAGPEICERLRQDPHSESTLIVIFGGESKPEELVACLEAGADDYLVKRCTRAELVARLKALLRCSNRLRDLTRTKAKGNLVAFFSAKGGTGTSSMCVNLAAAVKEMAPASPVLVVDMVLPLGSISSMMGLQSQDTIVGLTSERDQPLDHFTVESYVVPGGDGLHVLLGARDPAEAQLLQAEQVLPLFQILRSMYDYVFVDFGRALSRVSLPVIQRSDCLAVVLSPDASAIESTRACLNFFLAAHISRQRLFPILNLPAGRPGLSRKEVEDELQMAVDGFVPYSEDCFSTSINRGRPFVHVFPNHFASGAIRELANRLLDRLSHAPFGSLARV